MKKVLRKKIAVTLLEIMIVILLIGVITGALAFNMSGSIDKGRAFKTEQNMARIQEILMMEYIQGDAPLAEVVNEWENVIARSPLVLKKGEDVIRDGWKVKFDVKLVQDEISVSSVKFNEYQKAHAKQKSEKT